MAGVEWVVARLGVPVALAAIVACPPRLVPGLPGAAVPGLRVPFLPGIAFVPLWAGAEPRPGADGALSAPIAWDWLIWEILMAASLTLGSLATLKFGRVMATARWEASTRPAPPPPDDPA
jgi:hypothetical protein